MTEERRPSEMRWRDFVRLLDAGLFLGFLIDELEKRLPELGPSLAQRISDAWGEAEIERAENPEVSPDDFPDPLAEYLIELANDVADSNAPQNATDHMRALAVVSMHSALDTYARAVLPERRKARLADLIDKSLREAYQQPLDRKVYNALVEFDATRHLIVHNHGVITPSYVSRVIDNPFVAGEPRPIDGTLLLRYGRIAWEAGLAVRRYVHGQGGDIVA